MAGGVLDAVPGLVEVNGLILSILPAAHRRRPLGAASCIAALALPLFVAWLGFRGDVQEVQELTAVTEGWTW